MALGKTYQWIKLAEEDTQLVQDRKVLSFSVPGKDFCMTRVGEQYFAFARKCPHAGADMTEASLDPLGKIVCPLHRYKFDPKNGRNTSGEGYFLITYPVEHRSDGLYIGIPESSEKKF